MKLSHQKLKMMHLAKILMEQTDEEHTITVPEMIAELSKLGISAERKSIYDDLEYLQLFGLDICSGAIVYAQQIKKKTDKHSAAQKPRKRRNDALCGVFFVVCKL